MAYTTINKSGDYFNTKLYAGNDGTNAITGVGFQPDFNWIKDRTSTGEHLLVDAIRGMNNIRSNSTAVESANGSIHQQSLNSDGFTVAGTAGNSNASGRNYASWNWKANGAGSANTAGSINSTVSVNQTAGFSIVSYTSTGSNATIGHGLGVAPSMIIFKRRSGDTENWVVYHQSLGNTKSVILNGTDAQATSSARFQDTSPTSTVFSVGTSGDVNGGSSPFIAYCFAEKTGYSKFGSYTGNGNDNGTFVYTGFKPKFIITKRTDSASAWTLWDNKRVGYNPKSYRIEPDKNSAEYTGEAVYADQFSNGFKIRTGDTDTNASGGTYIYMAFGQSLVGSNNVPCTAR